MVKETKIGLALIGGLLVTFAGILGHRLTSDEDPQAALLEQAEGLLDDAQQQAQDALGGVVGAAQDALEQAPTVIAAHSGDDSAEEFASDEPQLDDPHQGFLPPSSAAGDRYATHNQEETLEPEPAPEDDEPAEFVDDDVPPANDPFSHQARAPTLTNEDPEEGADNDDLGTHHVALANDDQEQQPLPAADDEPEPTEPETGEPYVSDNPLYDAQGSVEPAAGAASGDRYAQRPGANQGAPVPADNPYAPDPADDRYASSQPGERYATSPEGEDRYAPGPVEPGPEDDSFAGDRYATDDQEPGDYGAQPLPADDRYADEPSDQERYAAEPSDTGERYPARPAVQPPAQPSVQEPEYEPAPAPRPARQRNGYIVQQGENYWQISEKLYGTGFYAGALEEHNRSRIPDDSYLQAGDEISAPPASVLEQTYPHLCPRQRGGAAAIARGDPPPVRTDRQGRRVYIVQEGDTLFDIARHQLGRAGLWVQIYDLNRQRLGDDVDRLEPGTELVLPPPRSARR